MSAGMMSLASGTGSGWTSGASDQDTLSWEEGAGFGAALLSGSTATSMVIRRRDSDEEIWRIHSNLLALCSQPSGPHGWVCLWPCSLPPALPPTICAVGSSSTARWRCNHSTRPMRNRSVRKEPTQRSQGLVYGSTRIIQTEWTQGIYATWNFQPKLATDPSTWMHERTYIYIYTHIYIYIIHIHIHIYTYTYT